MTVLTPSQGCCELLFLTSPVLFYPLTCLSGCRLASSQWFWLLELLLPALIKSIVLPLGPCLHPAPDLTSPVCGRSTADPLCPQPDAVDWPPRRAVRPTTEKQTAMQTWLLMRGNANQNDVVRAIHLARRVEPHRREQRLQKWVGMTVPRMPKCSIFWGLKKEKMHCLV